MRFSPILPSGALLAGLLSSAVVEVVAWGGGKGDKCASEWGQCGGKDWTGPKCSPVNTSKQVKEQYKDEVKAWDALLMIPPHKVTKVFWPSNPDYVKPTNF